MGHLIRMQILSLQKSLYKPVSEHTGSRKDSKQKLIFWYLSLPRDRSLINVFCVAMRQPLAKLILAPRYQW